MRLPILIAAMLGATVAAAEQKKPGVPPDNSKTNAPRERVDAPVADDAGSSKTDVEKLAAIRKALVDDDDLSTYAKNVKIVVRGNSVHLAGPVRSDAEKAEVEKIVTATAGGAMEVTSELAVTPR